MIINFINKIFKGINSWSPNVICKTCQSSLEGWLRYKNLDENLPNRINYKPKKYRIKWHKPKNHEVDCYFCLVDFTLFTRTFNKKDIKYPNIMVVGESCQPFFIQLSIFFYFIIFLKELNNETHNGPSEYETHSDETDESSHDDILPDNLIIQQSDINDCMRDLSLTKEKSEHLISVMKSWNVLPSSIKITSQRNRVK